MAVFVAWMKKTSYQKRETHAKGKSHNTEQKEREVNEKKSSTHHRITNQSNHWSLEAQNMNK